MRRLIVVVLSSMTACTCGTQARDKTYVCASDDDCAADFVCRGGICQAADGGGSGGGMGGGAGANDGGESCFSGQRRLCSITSCEQECVTDGTGYGPCVPLEGGDLTTNPQHCGACGVACSTAYGGVLGCVDSRCACATDLDCPAGQRCGQGGLCTAPTDGCASLRCDAGTVCRGGGCAVAACDQGCRPGEVCELTTGLCRFIDPCRLPAACPVDGGVCEGGLKPDNTPCADGDRCTSADVCIGGVCVGTPYTCSGTPGVCEASIACAGDGGCVAVPQPDGTACDDLNLCTHTDGCKAGTCSGTTYVCAPNICASASTCAGDGGCLNTPQNEGAACDDANLCSVDDVCVDGACVGSVYSCPMPAPCDDLVACTGDGGCLVVPKTNGAACDDGQACTAGDTCTANVCSGATGTTYRDLDGDGRGDLNISAMICPAPAGYVQQGGDCNDNDPDVFTFVQGLVRDLDSDGRSTGAAMGQCVGDTMLVGGRTAYRDADGNHTWLASSSSLGTDCDDADADVYEALQNAVTDADHDGHYSGAAAVACAGAASTVNGRSYRAGLSGVATYLLATDALGSAECDDATASIYRTVSAAVDADQDGYVVPNTAGMQCVGASAMVSGRTYYASAGGMLSWLSDAPLGTDCNDANAMTSGPFPWFYDADRDTFGGAGSVVACAVPDAGFVVTPGDCNDADADVFQSGVSVVPDDDRDGYGNGGVAASTAACIGAPSTFSARTYYRAASGLDTWLASAMSLGDDCDNGAPGLFASMPSMVVDADHDGYSSAAPATACVGSSTVVNGRTYFSNGAGAPVYLASATALGGGECNDADADVFRTVTAATDGDQDGYVVAGSSASQCLGATSLVSGRTYYSDASGVFSRLSGTALGDDCNDANAAVSGPFPWYFDGDADGTGGSTSLTSCASPGAGYVVTGGDCDDGNGNVYRIVTVGLVPDADRDGYRLSGSVSDTSECVGVSSTAGTRTYYRSAVGADSWLTASQALGNDCDDASAAVLGPRSWYADGDLDGVGSGLPTVACTAPSATHVLSGTDCNDSTASGGQFVYRNVGSLYDDTDRDGYTDSLQGVGTRCVGLSQLFSGRTYYRATSGNYTWGSTSLGTDCLDTNANVFQVRSNVLNDDDNDGYPFPNDNSFSACAGNPVLVSGRQYWVGPSGTADFISDNDCIGQQGNRCPNIDCYDQNANARPGQLSYFTVSRGDGSFDYDCSGTTSSSPPSGSYCASVTSATLYTDAACLLGAAAGNICNTPTSWFSGNATACGRFIVGTTGYYNNGVSCQQVTRASVTRVGCR